MAVARTAALARAPGVTRKTSLLADWAAAPAEPRGLAEVLLRACEPLSDEMLGNLAATPDDAAAALRRAAFADRVDGSYVPYDWLESFCTALRLPIAEIDGGWDISDGEDVYFCPRVLLADDPDSPDDTRPFVRIDQITRWTEPETGA
ncbi:MAG: hypothetical protein JO352_08190 [Chloroflexi bacterium]|nr:hypothetical protein [Chloroflexota bacterium]